MNKQHRINFGRMIQAAKGIYPLTRVALAKKATLAHAVVAKAEKGDETVDDAALVKIRAALENLGFEFLDGANSISLAFHEKDDGQPAAVCVDPTMPGMIRRIYPRPLSAGALIDDLEACGVRVSNKDALLAACAAEDRPWQQTIVRYGREGRKLGIRFYWESEANAAGAKNVIRKYDFSNAEADHLVAAMQDTN